MKLVAALIVHNERGRYLEPCLDHLLDFCDEVRVLDDYSTDGSCELVCDHADPRVVLATNEGPSLFEHEGRARQELLHWTMEGQPTHVLSIDADEFVTDGLALRDAVGSSGAPVFGLRMGEVWNLDYHHLRLRTDGGWRGHVAPIVWKAPDRLRGDWRILDRALSSGREPVAARRMWKLAREVTGILHFGWANPAGRRARYERYVQADGGKFHASAHLRSIMFPDARCRLKAEAWPDGLVAYRDRIVEAATRG